jgi:hypothetical protein
MTADTAQSIQQLGCGLHNRGTGVRFLAGSRHLSRLSNVQTASGAHETSYTMCTGGSISGGKVART